ncbi:MAG: 23S rRNA (adenine(2503)-C(2))-methyltransferase RlmN [Rickettsiales bacterium]|nr:23S rRNA (adenine(2503)-C(2))-methyltransferase RlmN [Rickettsiales bacterium]
MTDTNTKRTNNLKSIEKHAKVFAAPSSTFEGKQNVIGLDLEELSNFIQELQQPKFRSKQIYNWLYKKGVTSFDDMKNLPAKLIEQLGEVAFIERPSLIDHQKSTDGTQKWLWRMIDGQEIETVFIPEKNRGTLCVSSQVGCTLSCKFCHTGTQKLVRNLGAREIVLQVMATLDALDEWPLEDGKQKRLTNIVFMGMGEPLYNYDNVIKAIKMMIDENGMNFSRRKITVSTSGVVPMIEKLGQEVTTGLAISLHAVTDELRDEIVPLNKQFPLNDLLEACKNYPNVHEMRKITFEYVMLKDVNDSDDDARALVKLLKDVPAKINLIPFNPWPGTIYETSSAGRIAKFGKILERAGFETPVRRARGQDILAACGQLKSESERTKKSA